MSFALMFNLLGCAESRTYGVYLHDHCLTSGFPSRKAARRWADEHGYDDARVKRQAP